MGKMIFKEIIEKLRTIEIEYDEKIEEILKGSREPEIIERVKKLSEESVNIFNLILDLFDDKDEGYELIFHILAIIVKDVMKERKQREKKRSDLMSEDTNKLNYVIFEKIPLKKDSNYKYNEEWVKNRIEENPELLGLGDLVVEREKKQKYGRLDFLMKDPENNILYEVEVQLGKQLC